MEATGPPFEAVGRKVKSCLVRLEGALINKDPVSRDVLRVTGIHESWWFKADAEIRSRRPKGPKGRV